MKVCTKCLVKKSKENFYRGSQYKHGRTPWCIKCKSDYDKVWARRLKLDVINAYGKVCGCCKEDKIEFLSIDHVLGKRENRKFIRNNQRGSRFYSYLRDNNYPKRPRLRVLCYNCNMSKGFLGYCPHKDNKKWLYALDL